MKSYPTTSFCNRYRAVSLQVQWRQVHFSYSGYDGTCLYVRGTPWRRRREQTSNCWSAAGRSAMRTSNFRPADRPCNDRACLYISFEGLPSTESNPVSFPSLLRFSIPDFHFFSSSSSSSFSPFWSSITPWQFHFVSFFVLFVFFVYWYFCHVRVCFKFLYRDCCNLNKYLHYSFISSVNNIFAEYRYRI